MIFFDIWSFLISHFFCNAIPGSINSDKQKAIHCFDRCNTIEYMFLRNNFVCDDITFISSKPYDCRNDDSKKQIMISYTSVIFCSLKTFWESCDMITFRKSCAMMTFWKSCAMMPNLQIWFSLPSCPPHWPQSKSKNRTLTIEIIGNKSYSLEVSCIIITVRWSSK